MKDTDFYNAESATYSAKRYPAVARSFMQYFFKSRLSRTLSLLSSLFSQRGLRVLELGCADGFVSHAIARRYASSIGRFDAMDLAPEMIEAAMRRFPDSGVRFSVRTTATIGEEYDVIVEIGVLNYTELAPELEAVRGALAPQGRYVCSLSGSSSLQHRLKGPDAYRHLRSYEEYETELASHFRVIKKVPIGFFVPYLWKVPALARLLAPAVEALLRPLVPDLFHEKVYLLERR